MKLIIAIAFLALFHVGRGDDKPTDQKIDDGGLAPQPEHDDAAPAPAAPAPEGGSSCGSHAHGDRWCKSDTVSSICSFGEEFDFDCPGASKCQVLPGDSKKVQCFELRRNAQQPAGPPAGEEGAHDQARRRRDAEMEKSDQAPAPAAPQADEGAKDCNGHAHGDRWCKSETVTSVCSFGEVFDFDCPGASKCQVLPTDSKKVQCFEIRRNAEQPAGPPDAQNSEPQAPPQDSKPAPAPAPAPAEPAPAPAPAPAPVEPAPAPAEPAPAPAEPAPAEPAPAPEKSTDCAGGPKGTLKNGESVCTGETTYKHCHAGDLVDQTCEQGAKCLESPTVPNAVLCRLIVRNPPQEGPKEGSRRRRR